MVIVVLCATRLAARVSGSGGGGAIRWDNLSVCVAPHNGGRPLLRATSGVARAGRLMGVLGPSGAGKSTMLAALAGVTPARGFVVRGALRFNNNDDGARGADADTDGEKEEDADHRRVGVAYGTVRTCREQLTIIHSSSSSRSEEKDSSSSS